MAEGGEDHITNINGDKFNVFSSKFKVFEKLIDVDKSDVRSIPETFIAQPLNGYGKPEDVTRCSTALERGKNVLGEITL